MISRGLGGRSKIKQPAQSAIRKTKKPRFADAAEEEKYRGYLKNVRTLNQMKEYLSNYKNTMQKDVIKRLVVTIKKMEQDLSFFENNWQLFKSSNLDYVSGMVDEGDKEEEEEDKKRKLQRAQQASGKISYKDLITQPFSYNNTSSSSIRNPPSYRH